MSLAGFGGSPAFGATACVNPSGTGDCFSSIQSALDASPKGVTIKVKPGTYREDITISKPVSLNGILNSFSPPGFLDCGITLASHPNVFGTGPVSPGSGVFKNTITRNSSTNNGCGIDIFDSSPGTKVHDNTVSQNILAGNGLAGIAMHAIGTGQDMSGNQLTGNWIGLNNTFGDSAAGDQQATGILLWSIISPVKNLAIKGNTIVGGNHFGIWISGPIQAKVSGNHINATVQVHKG